jgi:phage terminase small subunit
MAAYQEIILSSGEVIKLTEKEMLFVQHYLGDADRNATKAVIKAGFSERSARTYAAQALAKSNIQKYIHHLSAPLLEKLNITRERVMREYAGIAFSRLKDYMNSDYTMKALDDIPEEAQIAMSQVDVDEESTQIGDSDAVLIKRRVRFKLHDKIKALDKLYEVLHPEDKKEDQGSNVYLQLNQYFNNK